jgi:flagellar motor switch protein FliN
MSEAEGAENLETFDAEKEMMMALQEEANAKPLSERTKDPSLDRILDIPLMLSAQLGNTRILIKDLLQLGPGSIVELDKLAGEPLEVLVNDKLVARGEVVMVNEKFGIRLTDVVSPTERVNKLR